MRRGTYIFITQQQNIPEAEHQSDTAFVKSDKTTMK